MKNIVLFDLIRSRYLLYSLSVFAFSPARSQSTKQADSITINNSARYKITELARIPSGVMGMDIDQDGVLYLSDTYSRLDNESRIYTLNPPYTGTLAMTAIEGQSLAGLMWHGDLLYTAFLNKDEVVIYDRDLEFQVAWPAPSPINFTSDGRTIFVLTYFGEIGALTRSRIRMFVNDLQNPFDIQFTGHESIWVSQKGMKLTEIGYEGDILRMLDLPLKEPRGLAMDDHGCLFIADAGTDTIYCIDPEGSVSVVTSAYKSPICIVSLPNGDLLINTDQDGGLLIRASRVR